MEEEGNTGNAWEVILTQTWPWWRTLMSPYRKPATGLQVLNTMQSQSAASNIAGGVSYGTIDWGKTGRIFVLIINFDGTTI